MKKVAALCTLVVLAPSGVASQSGTPEQEVRALLAEYEEAVARRDIEFLERVLSEDYSYTGPNARRTDREGALRHFRRLKEAPTYVRISLEHINVTVRVVGSMAVTTHDWISQTKPMDAPDADPITDRGRYTGVLERREGRWVVVAEHDSEQIYEDDWMIAGVEKAGREYQELLKRLKDGRSSAEQDKVQAAATLGRMLATEYTFTGPDGECTDRAGYMNALSSHAVRVERAEYLEQNVRTIGNGTAVETGAVRYVGTRGGMRVEVVERHTITWAFYDGRWQITAQHVSVVRQ